MKDLLANKMSRSTSFCRIQRACSKIRSCGQQRKKLNMRKYYIVKSHFPKNMAATLCQVIQIK